MNRDQTIARLQELATNALKIAPGDWEVEGPDCNPCPVTGCPEINVSQDQNTSGYDMRLTVKKVMPRRYKIGGPSWTEQESKCIQLAQFIAAANPAVILQLIQNQKD